jgi:hypothetical protein
MQRLNSRQKRDVIVRALEKEHRLPPGSILSHDRHKEVTKARFRAFLLLKVASPHLSYCQIGRLFDRDHSTIMYGIARIFGHNSSWCRTRAGAAAVIRDGLRFVGPTLEAEVALLLDAAVPVNATVVSHALAA